MNSHQSLYPKTCLSHHRTEVDLPPLVVMQQSGWLVDELRRVVRGASPGPVSYLVMGWYHGTPWHTCDPPLPERGAAW